MRNARPRALPGALPALRRLRRRGVRLGLVTASTRSVVEPNLRRLNIGDLFEAARFADDVANGKPHPEALIAALDEMGVAPADSVYIGDTVVDLQMASAAGAPFVAVGTTTRPEAFRAAGADPVWAGIADWTDVLLGPRRPAPRRGAATTRDPVRPARQRGPADG
jgi:phosphoglycolate phosphatase-like HAD superfamily hydrolase